MSANLDKSLDEIIGSNKAGSNRARVGGTRGNGPRRVGKQVGSQRRSLQTEEALSEKILGHLQTQSLELPSSWTPLERSRSTSKVCQGTLSRML